MPASPRSTTIFALLAAMSALLASSPRSACAVQVQDIARLKGAEQHKIIGMGLVFGLKGTGDGGKFMPAMRPLAETLSKYLDPQVVAAELKDAKNVAVVAISATIPASGARSGDTVDVQLSTVGACKSLAGGRLFLVPLVGPRANETLVYALAEGAVTIEDAATPTVGVIRGGGRLTADIFNRHFDQFGQITLVLNEANATWPMASNLSSHVNETVSPDGPKLARAIDQKNIVIQVPEYERANPGVFISRIMQSYLDPAMINTGARVVINEKTGTIIVTGEVTVSPVLISHKGLTINTVTPVPVPTVLSPKVEGQNFVAVDSERRGGAKLADLLTAFNQLKVEAHDRIAIIKEIHRSGKLHAQLILE